MINAPAQISLSPIGCSQMVTYSTDPIRQWLLEHYQAENIRIEVRPIPHIGQAFIDCTWTSKPRLGQKNRAYLAAHGIKV